MGPSSIDSRRISTKDYVYSEIRNQIVEGKLLPEQQINEKELTESLGISRTPLREALQRIELEELIIRLPNGRMKVAPVSVEEAKEIFNVRSLLEGLVTREATVNATPHDISELEFLTDLLVKAAQDNNSDNVIFYGDKIHHYIYRVSKNNIAVKILNNMNDHIMRYRRIGPKTSQNRGLEAAKEHQKLYEAIASKDAEGAELLMRSHITNSLDAAIKSIEMHLKNENN